MKTDIVLRENPIHIHKGHDFSNPTAELRAKARPAEEYAFQIAVKADKDISDISVIFRDLQGDGGTIPADRFFSINFGGNDYTGKKFIKKVSLKNGESAVLWISVRIPENASGVYSGKMFLVTDGEKKEIPLHIEVCGEKAEKNGHGEPALFTRLSWLNSTRGLDKEPTKDYPAPTRNGNVISVLGRKFYIGENGFPEKISSFFNLDLKIGEKENTVSEAIRLTVKDETGADIPFTFGPIGFSDDREGISWTVRGESALFGIEVRGRAEFDGYMDIVPVLTAKSDCGISDISLSIPYEKEFSKYAMGLGLTGGYAPDRHEFKWDETKHQNPFWMGGINGGVRCEFRGENFVTPFVNIYYRHRPYTMTKAFCNGGKGGVIMEKGEKAALVTAYSGSRTVTAGETLDFSFDILVTPLKELDTKKRFNTRYYHRESGETISVAEAKAVGANYINVHHAVSCNPYINYPFVANKELKELVREAHENGIGVKIYYTVREQSDRTSELWAMRALGDEIFPKPREGQKSVLWNEQNLELFAQELGADVIPAWKSDRDNSLITDGCSRLCNYYAEGLNLLVREQDIDGIYIDDVAYDRITMRRARKILDRKDGCLIDMHSWNHSCDLAGKGNSLNMYMPLLPYIDSVWMGEGFKHDRMDEDFWIVEMMGLPYGMASEILPSSPNNQYRGMLFGVTTRYPWCGGNPKGLWDFIKVHRLAETEMHGFWNPETKIKTSDEKVKATLFEGKDENVIAIASWADGDRDVTLHGLSTEGALIPAIDGFQSEEKFTGKISIPALGGKIIVIKKQNG